MHLSSIAEGDETEEEGPAKPTSQKFAKISTQEKMAEKTAAMRQKFLKKKAEIKVDTPANKMRAKIEKIKLENRRLLNRVRKKRLS